MRDEEDAVTISLANEIVRYLEAHPNAADSAKGIAEWWLTRQRVSEALEAVEHALAYLVTKGVLTTVNNSDATRIFMKSEKRAMPPPSDDSDE